MQREIRRVHRDTVKGMRYSELQRYAKNNNIQLKIDAYNDEKIKKFEHDIFYSQLLYIGLTGNTIPTLNINTIPEDAIVTSAY
jgi:hypothetical protein